MQLYRVIDAWAPPDERVQWVPTKAAAARVIRPCPAEFRAGIEVQLVDIKVNRANLLTILNDGQPGEVIVLRTWRGSARGGLKEKPKG